MFAVRGATSDRFYAQERGLVIGSHEAGVTFETRWRRTQLRAGHTIRYSPFVSLDMLAQPGGGWLTDPSSSSSSSTDNAAFRRSGVTHVLRAEVMRSFGRHSAFTVAYDVQRADFSGVDADLRAQAFGARFTRVVSRYGTIRLGYGRQIAEYGALSAAAARAARTQSHDLDFGVDYSRPLSFSRRTTIAVRTGSVLITAADGRGYRLTGEASANHQLGRRWIGRLSYLRGLQFIGGLAEPVFSDTLNITLDGRPRRRIEATLSTGVSLGRTGLDATAARYSGYSGTARLRRIITPRFALDTRYVYSQYRLTDSLHPTVAVASRPYHSVQAGFTWWVGGRR
jgi:hypothetical protein